MTRATHLIASFGVTICLLLTNFQAIGDLYFTQLGYNVFSASIRPDDVVLEMRVHSIPSVLHPEAVGADIDCSVGSVLGRDRSLIKDPKRLFQVTVERQNATVRLIAAAALDRETYHVTVRCTDKTNGVSNYTSVYVHHYHHDDRRRHHNFTETLCRRPITFQLAENVDGVVLGTLPCASSAICPHNSTQDCGLLVRGRLTRKNEGRNLDFSDHITIEPRTGQLMVNQSFDRELVSQLDMTYFCPSGVNALNGQANYSCKAELTILDVDDNGPWFSRRDEPFLTQYQETRSRLYELKKGTQLISVVFNDNDLTTSNKYRISIENDYNGLFSASDLNSLEPLRFSYVKANRDVDPVTFNVSLFNIVVRIIDSSFISSVNNTAIYNATFLLPTHWKPVKKHAAFPSLSISASASLYSQVYAMGYLRSPAEYRIETQLVDADFDVTDLFQVTPREGIIYVNNPKHLRILHNETLVVHVKTCAAGMNSCASVLNISVTVGGRGSVADGEAEAVSCASYSDEWSCEGATGLGSPEGHCRWRNSSGNFSSLYSTCSPSLSTCPDEDCDELEMNVTGLCPQDCSTKKPISDEQAELNHLYSPARGIAKAIGPCYCTMQNCFCHLHTSNATKQHITEVTEMSTSVEPSGFERCGSTCRLMLLVGLTSLLVLTLVLVMWRCIYYRRKMQTMRGHGSGIVPSDYLVAPGSVTTDYTDYASAHLLDWHQQNFLDIQADPKWEFNRGYIKIESILGEGEFGKVVKAQAWNIQGTPGHTTVAVKMLKECASGVEYRDLLSELNLLKQVNHRNVIKLLGVCSRKGPLYVIVEFCKHGSLRSFLRRVRGKKEYLITRDHSTIVPEIHKESEKPSTKVTEDLAEEGVSVQDLLSFSWQIGKGMEYLSGMKVVHRDLAARNILLATGKVIKVSDFGLSRDVYEGDAYLKTSKGPLPVKWMAPESLYDQICTTKSDIWSYGIVLWEIFTLGANPYPGTPAERLYQLLKTGYRMEKPASCSDELFSVMLKCWQDNPDKRPTFKELADIFEQFLSLDKEYLDLNACEGLLQDDSAFLTSGTPSAATHSHMRL